MLCEAGVASPAFVRVLVCVRVCLSVCLFVQKLKKLHYIT